MLVTTLADVPFAGCGRSVGVSMQSSGAVGKRNCAIQKNNLQKRAAVTFWLFTLIVDA